MNNSYFVIDDNFLESSRLVKKFIRGKRCVLGFNIGTDISVNGTVYKKNKGIDIDIDSQSITASTKISNVKIKVKDFSLVQISFENKVVCITVK